MHGLVVPCFHAEPCPYAAAYDGEQEQGAFGYTPFPFLGLQLVDAIDKENYGIYSKQAIYDCQVYIHLATI